MVCLLITGCSIGKKDNPNEKPEQKNVSMKNVNYTNKSNKPNEKAADHLASLAASVPGVNDATAVVVGKYAIVGIDVKAKLDRTRVESIKYSVAESLKNAAIVGRVMPQVPNDMIENRETNPIKDNDKQLPKDEEQELRKEQNDQSNNHLNK